MKPQQHSIDNSASHYFLNSTHYIKTVNEPHRRMKEYLHTWGKRKDINPNMTKENYKKDVKWKQNICKCTTLMKGCIILQKGCIILQKVCRMKTKYLQKGSIIFAVFSFSSAFLVYILVQMFWIRTILFIFLSL
jgi:hypothetical protein